MIGVWVALRTGATATATSVAVVSTTVCVGRVGSAYTLLVGLGKGEGVAVGGAAVGGKVAMMAVSVGAGASGAVVVTGITTKVGVSVGATATWTGATAVVTSGCRGIAIGVSRFGVRIAGITADAPQTRKRTLSRYIKVRALLPSLKALK